MAILSRLQAKPWVVMIALCLGTFMALLDTTIVDIAVPGILGGLAVAAGPILGGFLVTNFGWPSIFFVNLLVGAVALGLVILVVPDLRPGRRHRLDLLGVLLFPSSWCWPP